MLLACSAASAPRSTSLSHPPAVTVAVGGRWGVTFATLLCCSTRGSLVAAAIVLRRLQYARRRLSVNVVHRTRLGISAGLLLLLDGVVFDGSSVQHG